MTMKLKTLLEEEHSKKQCERIVRYIGADKTRFAELMELFLKGEYRITQRAAWPMSYCVQAHPELIRPYFKSLLDNLGKKGLHDAVIRNTLRILQELLIPKKHQGRLMDLCFQLIGAPETPIAIKAFSLTILHHLSRQYPEIRLIIDQEWEHSTPAFRSRAKAFDKEFNKAAGSL